MRQRKEIQKMLWRLSCFVAAFALSGTAALLPESFAGYSRGEVAQIKPADYQVWNEYGLTGAERAEYSGPSGQVSITVYRLKDPTGAFAAFQWQRPGNAESGTVAASLPDGSLVAHANYLVRVEGGKLNPRDAQDLYKKLPDQVSTSLPPLYSYLPVRGRVPNSERYLLGSASLAAFEPRIPADLAALDRGAEAQLARYRSGGSEFQVTIISYPTPQMASAFARKFEALPGVAIRRTGPLLTVVPEGASVAAVGKLIEQINYSPNLTWSEHVPKDTPQDAARMILAIIALAGGLIVSALVLGLLFGGSRVLARRLGWASSDERFTALHLEGK
jgi:hypothetical protein